jgi:hypothetical protein
MRTMTLVALLACAGTWSGHAQGDPDSDAVSKIVAMEQVWAQALHGEGLNSVVQDS